MALASVTYLVLTFSAPRGDNPNPYHFSIVAVLVLTVTIIGLWFLTCFFGFYAWLKLDTYARLLPRGVDRRAYGQIAQGVRILAYGLLVSSVIGATNPYFIHSPSLGAVVKQINYYIIILAPFLGFLYLRWGTKRLAVSAHAAMSLRSKLVTVGPPVLLLAGFYVFLAATNVAPDGQLQALGRLGFLVLPLNIILVVGSWVLGLLAALNIERATYRGVVASHTKPLVKLYNGILTMTGGFIILDALMSLGSTRLASLPLSVTVSLLYGFIGVVGFGFMLVSVSARALITAAMAKTGG